MKTPSRIQDPGSLAIRTAVTLVIIGLAVTFLLVFMVPIFHDMMMTQLELYPNP